MASPEDVVKNTNQGDDVTEVEEEESSTSNDNNNEPPATQEEELTETAIEEMARGMVYASLAITDDKENTLEKVGKANPWQVEALKIITGSNESAHRHLTEILQDDMNLQLDKYIDVSGMTKGGHFLDTQGFIAHNDNVIVLSYRCTTSAFDWLTNLNSTSSAWEIEEDLEQGYSGLCSGFEGFCCNGGEYKPRVHTGFYNNFLASLPHIKEHIEPLLTADQPGRKLYVVGHSLGGGVATLAACYFMLHFDWATLPHSLVGVTAGSPRSCATSMKTLIDERMQQLGRDSVRMYRLVKDKDVVPKVPPTFMSFQHVGPPAFIDDEGTIHIKHMSPIDTEGDADVNDLRSLVIQPQLSADEGDDEKDPENKSKYERFIGRIPKSFRDHMPEFYLKPLFTARGITRGVQLENNQPIQAAEKSPLAAKEAAHMEQSIAELPAAAKEQPTRKGLLGRVFGRKRSQRVK